MWVWVNANMSSKSDHSILFLFIDERKRVCVHINERVSEWKKRLLEGIFVFLPNKWCFRECWVWYDIIRDVSLPSLKWSMWKFSKDELYKRKTNAQNECDYTTILISNRITFKEFVFVISFLSFLIPLYSPNSQIICEF
jgi:hypothetical protein